MKIIDSYFSICPCCMEKHKIEIVQISEQTYFNDKLIYYTAIYTYCKRAKEFYMTEEQLEENSKQIRLSYSLINK